MEIRYDPLPTIKLFHESAARHRVLVGSVGCYSGDTEFLTPTGWKRFDEYTDESVAQWNEKTKQISFVKPEKYIKEECKEFIYFHNNYSLSMLISDDHRMPLYDYRGKFKVKTATDIEKTPSRYTVPINFRITKTDYNLSDMELRLMVAFHADGNIAKQGRKHRITLRKERKKKRLEWLLNSLNLEFTIVTSKNRPTEIGYAFVPPRLTKSFDTWGWKLSERQLKIVVDEMIYWDGRFEGDDYSFTTTNKGDADFIQYAVHATGGRAYIGKNISNNPKHKDVYSVSIALPGSYKTKVMLRSDTTSIERKPSTDGFKYCFTVPTGFLVVRHNDRVFVSGNSGKTAGCIIELLYYMPVWLFNTYGIKKTRMLILRNTHQQLRDTTLNTLYQWFPTFELNKSTLTGKLRHSGLEIEVLLRSCDNDKDIRRFKSLEITAALFDEQTEISQKIVLMVANRVGRYPSKQEIKKLTRKKIEDFGWIIAATNPPDTDHYIYNDYKHMTPVPGPLPEGKPLKDHECFWQPQNENEANLPKNYYRNLIEAYAGNPDWIQRYIQARPGIMVQGKLVYSNFVFNLHIAKEPLIWNKGTIYCGWDNSGNTPACVLCQVPTPGVIQVLKEYFTERMNMTDFTKYVIADRNLLYPDAEYVEYDDPAGHNQFSHPIGGFTSNAEIMQKLGVDVNASEQNLKARLESVDGQLGRLVTGMPGLQIDPSCKVLLNGFLGGYCYPEVGTTGYYKDKPMKNKFSHCFTANTLVLTEQGNKKIKDITTNDYVITPQGLRRVIKSWKTQEKAKLIEIVLSNNVTFETTLRHNFCINNKVIPANEIKVGDILEEIKPWELLCKSIQNLLSLMVESIDYQVHPFITEQRTGEQVHPIYIEQSGNSIMEEFLMVMKSTIKTEMGSITICPILNVEKQKNIEVIIQKRTIQDQCFKSFIQNLLNGPKYGILLKKGWNGIQNTVKKLGLKEKLLQRNVKCVEKNTKHLFLKEVDFVGLPVNQKLDVETAKTIFKGFVRYAGILLQQINILKRKHAPKVVAINYVAEQKSVYNITVEHDHVYYANNCLVQNCQDALQYVIVKLITNTTSRNKNRPRIINGLNWKNTKVTNTRSYII